MQFSLLLKVVGVSAQVVRRVWQLPEEMTRLVLYSDVVGIACPLACRQLVWRTTQQPFSSEEKGPLRKLPNADPR